MAIQSVRLRKPITETLKLKVEAHRFNVGILEAKKRRKALPPSRGTKNLAGGPARKLGVATAITNSEVSKYLRGSLGFNYLVKPFRQKNDDAVKMLNTFFQLVFSEGNASIMRRLENLIQAVVRNPIVRGDYGSNTPEAKRAKGFSRRGIDTGQLFKVIKAKVIRK